jgi:beta-glucosidase
VSAPANKMDKPSEELKAFAKTNLLQPGKSQTITFTLIAADLASFDTNSSSWIAEAGTYTVRVGSSSTKIRFSKPFTLASDIIVEKDNKVLSPQVNINELKKQGTKETGFIDELSNFSAVGQ